MGKSKNRDFSIKAIPLSRLEPGEVLLLKKPKRKWTPGLTVLEIQVMMEDGRTPYENMKLQDIGARARIIRIHGLFWQMQDVNAHPMPRWDQKGLLYRQTTSTVVFGDQVFYEGFLYANLNKNRIVDNLIWTMSS